MSHELNQRIHNQVLKDLFTQKIDKHGRWMPGFTKTSEHDFDYIPVNDKEDLDLLTSSIEHALKMLNS